MTKKRIGIFGGTFDPVHQGHIQVALHIRSLLSLDWVDFVPAYDPPHKCPRPEANAWHRFAMLVLATSIYDGLYVSTIELETTASAYTIDTIKRLKHASGHQAEFYFIMGADSFEELTTWKDHDQLLDSCHFAVMTRPGHSLSIDHMPEAVRGRIIDLRRERPESGVSSGYQIYLCGDVSNPVSSTNLREALKEGRWMEEVPRPVRLYIEKYKLYQRINGTQPITYGTNSVGSHRQ